LYAKPFEVLPASIKWGIENEPKANQQYISYAEAYGKKELSIRKCGFIVHPTMGWLGASPDDAHVTDPHSDFPDDTVEFKCIFSKKRWHHVKHVMTQIFTTIMTVIISEESHHYYHQVQL